MLGSFSERDTYIPDEEKRFTVVHWSLKMAESLSTKGLSHCSVSHGTWDLDQTLEEVLVLMRGVSEMYILSGKPLGKEG